MNIWQGAGLKPSQQQEQQFSGGGELGELKK